MLDPLGNNDLEKSSTSYHVVLLEIGASLIEVLDMQRVYKYITKVKNMPNHILPSQECKSTQN